MFKVYRTKEFEYLMSKLLTQEEQKRVEKIEEEIAESGFTGNPLGCQKPPFIEGWHAANANVIQWFLSTVGIPR